MPRQTIEAVFSCPPEKVWRIITDPVQWVWPGGPAWVRTPMDGRWIVTVDRDEMETEFQITAFAPPRWYAAEVENRKAKGRCEVLLFRERGGTRVEFTADVEGRTPAQKLLLRLRLRQWQERYIEAVRRALEVG